MERIPTENELFEKLKAQGYRCALTGVKVSPATASLDHKIPLSRGGSDELHNLQFVTKVINKAKGALTVKEFVAMCQRVADHANK